MYRRTVTTVMPERSKDRCKRLRAHGMLSGNQGKHDRRYYLAPLKTPLSNKKTA
jgi:hypothetical protein